MTTKLRFNITVVQFYGKFGPGYSFDLAFQDCDTKKVYEGLFWYPEDDKVEPAMVLENDAMDEAYKDNFTMHPNYKDYLEIVLNSMPSKKELEDEHVKKSGGSDEI